MRWFSLISLVRDILALIDRITERLKRRAKIKKLEGASHESLITKDQRAIENEISGVSGKPSKHKHTGLRTRKRKERN